MHISDARRFYRKRVSAFRAFNKKKIKQHKYAPHKMAYEKCTRIFRTTNFLSIIFFRFFFLRRSIQVIITFACARKYTLSIIVFLFIIYTYNFRKLLVDVHFFARAKKSKQIYDFFRSFRMCARESNAFYALYLLLARRRRFKVPNCY